MCKEFCMIPDQLDELYDLWIKEDRYCMLHPGMQCKVILCPNGNTYAHYDEAGSTSVPVSVWEGKDVELFTICYQNQSIEDYAEISFEQWLNDHGFLYDPDLSYKELKETFWSEYNDYCEEVADYIIDTYCTPYAFAEMLENSPIAHTAHDWAFGEGEYSA